MMRRFSRTGQIASDGADADWSFMHGEMVTPDRSKRRLRELASGKYGTEILLKTPL